MSCLARALRVMPPNPSDTPHLSVPSSQTTTIGATELVLDGYLLTLDPVMHVATIQWVVKICASEVLLPLDDNIPENGAATEIAPACTLPPDARVDLYFDFSPTANWTYNSGSAVYSLYDGQPLSSTAGMQVQTAHELDWTARRGQDELFVYPFDTYTMDIFVRTTYTPSGQPSDDGTAGNGSTPIGVRTMRLSDNTNVFDPSLVLDVPALQSLSVQRHPDDITHEEASAPVWHHVRCTFQRTPATRALVVLMLIACWLTTVLAVGVAVKAVWGHPGGASENALFFPFSAILIIGSLRAWWIGAPAFNSLIDYVATLPQLALLTAAFLGSVYKLHFGAAGAPAMVEPCPAQAWPVVGYESDPPLTAAPAGMVVSPPWATPRQSPQVSRPSPCLIIDRSANTSVSSSVPSPATLRPPSCMSMPSAIVSECMV